MICEKCKEKVNWSSVENTQGWKCSVCGWDIVTTYIEEIYTDETKYSIYIKKLTETDVEKIRVVAKTVEFIDFNTKTFYLLRPYAEDVDKKYKKEIHKYIRELKAVYGEEWNCVIDIY